MIYVTADTHFGHKNILYYDQRPFATIEEHDAILIENWNQTVKPEDEVYHLGDFSLASLSRTLDILDQLHGTLYLIKGNHDARNLREARFREKFAWIESDAELSCGGYVFWLYHYPIHEWCGCHRGAIHLHGHTHGRDDYAPNLRRMNVGCTLHGFKPLSLDAVIEQLKGRPSKSHHNKTIEA